MKSKPWKPAGLQKFNKFCMAVDEDCKSPVGQKFKEEYQQKALKAYTGNKLRKRKASPTATVAVYLDVVVKSSTSSSLASVESSQHGMTSSAATPRPPPGQSASHSSSSSVASVKNSQRAMAPLVATPSQQGQPTRRGTVHRGAGHTRRGGPAIGGTIDSTLVAAASNITPM
jgi:hypothetical protein